MRIECDKVITTDDFDEKYSMWQGRTLTVMGEYIKVSQPGIHSRYFDTIYLFESTGIMIGFKMESYQNVISQPKTVLSQIVMSMQHHTYFKTKIGFSQSLNAAIGMSIFTNKLLD